MNAIKVFITKYRFLVCFIFILIIVPVIILFITRSQKITNFYSNDSNSISKIIITNGNNGEILEITDYDQICKVTQYLSQIKIKRKLIGSRSNGWNYKLKITLNNEKSIDIVFAGINSQINDKKYSISGPQFKDLVNELSNRN